MIKKERKRRRGETASDDATGEEVEARQHSEREVLEAYGNQAEEQ